MYKIIINVNFSVHPFLPVGCDPSYIYSGKAICIENSHSLEEGISFIKNKLSNSKFTIIKEDKNGN